MLFQRFNKQPAQTQFMDVVDAPVPPVEHSKNLDEMRIHNLVEVAQLMESESDDQARYIAALAIEQAMEIQETQYVDPLVLHTAMQVAHLGILQR